MLMFLLRAIYVSGQDARKQKIYFDLICHVKANRTSVLILYTTEAANNTCALFEQPKSRTRYF